MRFTRGAFLICLVLNLPASAQPDDEIARRFYPELLVTDAAKFSDEPVPPRYDYVRGDLTGEGSKFLIVAYSNSRIGALRVIDVRGTPTLVGENLDLLGNLPKVELFDLDRDGKPEIIVLLAAMRTDFTSLFKWTSSGLELWGPRETNHRGVERTILPTIDYADLDGDGLLELIEVGDPEMGIPSGAAYRLAGGDYVPAKPVAYHVDYVRGTGEPERVRSTFKPLPGDPGKWVLRVINGDHNGAKAVTAGEIRLNDVVIVSDDKFRTAARLIRVPVTLRASNVLEVELRGNPGTGLTVAVTKE